MIKKTLFMILAWAVLTLPALAEEKAADSMIAAVQSNLNRYEPMVASMSPGSRSGARVSRFVPIMESRLSSSRHQTSASWIETSKRLQGLKQALLDIKAGKKPSVPAASNHSTTPAQANMSDPDRARKIEALNSAFIRDINRVRGNDIAKPSIAHNFMQKIAAMQALSAGFQDNSLGYVQQVNGFILESDHFLQKRIAAAEATVKNNHQASSSTSMQHNMSDRDRAMKIEKLRSAFYTDFNHAGVKDLSHENIVKGFAQRIDVMKEMASGFQDNSIGFVKQVKGFVVETEGYFKKRTAKALAISNNNKQRRGSLKARNDKTVASNKKTGQSERAINGIHTEFSRAFSSVRGSLKYLSAQYLAKPEEARDWIARIKTLKEIVDQYQDKTHTTATKDIATYSSVKERFDKAVKELAVNNKQQYEAIMLQQADKATRQAALKKQQHRDNLHRQFAQAYGTLRISLPYLNAETLADPREAEKWSSAVKRMGAVVSQYQDKSDPKVLEDIATYHDVKSRVESALAQNAAAAGGLTTQDLLRDHQALQELVVKYKPFFSKLNINDTGSLPKIEAFNQGSGKAAIETALASFAKKYGNNRVAIAAKFTLVNGGKVWRSPQRYVPESGFESLSEWMNDLNAGQETALASKEDNSGIKRLFAFPGGHQVDVKFPVLDIANTNLQFEKARHALDGLLKKHPNREQARQSRDELDVIKKKFLDGMNKAIDDVRWKDRDDEFVGPGDVDDIKAAAMRFLKLKGKALAFAINSYEWYVNDEDVYGRPINYALTFKYAEKIKNKPDTAMIKQVALVTAGASKSLPFVKATGAGGHWEIRIKNLP